jgi:hypothetical protein
LIRFFYRQAKIKVGQTPEEIERAKPQLHHVLDAIKDAWGIELKNCPYWIDIDEIRLVANCIKHGDGPNVKDLKAKHPDWFDGEIITPLGGDGLKLPDGYLGDAARSVTRFLSAFMEEVKKVEI